MVKKISAILLSVLCIILMTGCTQTVNPGVSPGGDNSTGSTV